jgi:hypothetical protein
LPNDIRLLIFLLFFPFLCACVFAFLKKNSLRDKLVIISSFVIFLAVLGLFAAHFHHDVQFFAVKSAVFDWLVI